MNLPKLKYLIRETIRQVKENGPAVAPSKPKPGTKPGTKPEKPTKRRPLTPPKTAPQTSPKAEGKVNENERDILNKIVKRFKSRG